MRILDIKQLASSSSRGCGPSTNRSISQMHAGNKIHRRYLHSTRHIITCTRENIWPMGTPMNLPYRVFMSGQLGLTYTSDPSVVPKLDHATIPYFNRLVHARTSQHPRSIFVPIQSDNLSSRDRYCEGSSGEWLSERVGIWCICWSPKVEYFHCTVRGTCGKNLRLVRGKQSLIYTGMVRI